MSRLMVSETIYGSLVSCDMINEKETHEDLDELCSSREACNRILSSSRSFSREYDEERKA
jgi:hypothetical protein